MDLRNVFDILHVDIKKERRSNSDNEISDLTVTNNHNYQNFVCVKEELNKNEEKNEIKKKRFDEIKKEKDHFNIEESGRPKIEMKTKVKKEPYDEKKII